MNLTDKQGEEALSNAIARISTLESRCRTLESEHKDLESEHKDLESEHKDLESEHKALYVKYQAAPDAIKDQSRRLARYENPDSPPSANPL